MTGPLDWLEARLKPTTQWATVLWALALLLVMAFALGYITGFETAPRYDTRLIHCSIEHAPGHTPCPPPIGKEVWAVWEGGVRTLATWDGRQWTLSQAILGSRTTTLHPIAWVEL